MGKYKHFKALGFLYISCEVLIHKIFKTRVTFHSKGKIRKTSTFQNYCKRFLNISREAEIDAIPKT